MRENKRMMTFKDTRIILFASLIVAMLLPFGGIQIVQAQETTRTAPDLETKIILDWNKSEKVSSTDPRLTGTDKEEISSASGGVTTTTCTHYASMSNKCQGWDNIYSNFYYRTPNNYLTPDFCQNYTCADTDHFQWAPPQVSEGGYGYAFKTATFYACAHDAGVCTSPTTWTDPYSATVHHNNVPTDDQITANTIYVYEKAGGQKVTYAFVNYLTQGYS